MVTRRVDLNADMGEGFGAWSMGDDAALLDIVTSANIACGFHAGDPEVMARTMAAAAARGVGIGAHPGFADLQGFGRRRMDLSSETLRAQILYQLGAASAMARAAGQRLAHVKLHGALANMVSEDQDLAQCCYGAVAAFDPALTVVAIAATAGERAARDLGLSVACEIYADRAYNDDGTLVDRRQEGAVLHDPDMAADRVVAMLSEGAIIARSGRRLPTRIDTICVHGDTAEAVAMAGVLRTRLMAADIVVRRLPVCGSQ
ncbi:MAG: LamB/YcsF family protein [Qingshengfaniella sp.]